MELAKKEKKGKKEGSKLPEWWLKETPEFRAAYIAEHPKSKFAKTLRETKKATLKANPKLRKKLRAAAKDISSNPEKVLPKSETDKLSPDTLKKELSPKKVAAMEKDLKAAVKGNKPSKAFRKHMITALKVAGLLTLGGAVLATGGLPYVILGAHLLKDGKEAFDAFKSKVKEGEETLSALTSSTKDAINKAMKDPNLIQTAMIAQNHSRLGRQSQRPFKRNRPSSKSDDNTTE